MKTLFITIIVVFVFTTHTNAQNPNPVLVGHEFSATKRAKFETFAEDIDNDGVLEIIAFGEPLDLEVRGYIYKLDKNGIYKKPSKPFLTVNLAFGGEFSVLFKDFDNDGDKDLAISILKSVLKLHTYYYENDGKGLFSNRRNINVSNLRK